MVEWSFQPRFRQLDLEQAAADARRRELAEIRKEVDALLAAREHFQRQVERIERRHAEQGCVCSVLRRVLDLPAAQSLKIDVVSVEVRGTAQPPLPASALEERGLRPARVGVYGAEWVAVGRVDREVLCSSAKAR